MTPSLTPPVKKGARVCDGPLNAHIASYRAKLEDLGYKPETVLDHLRLFAKFDLWLLRRRRRLWRLNEEDADRFLKHLHTRHHRFRSALRLVLKLLRDVGAIAPKSKSTASSPAQRLVNEYRVFLKEERGLDRATICNYSRHIDGFLNDHFGAGRVNLRALGGLEITSFVRRQATRHARGWAAQMVTGLRSFFRFAQFKGLIASDLAAVVPPVANWTMAGLPKYLSTEAVQRVLGSCERATVRGKRDYAILLMLARLGLRGGEIVTLQLDDIDWASAEIAIRSKKGDGWARLPLLVDVGQALAGYLAVRPSSAHRNVFVRDYAPYTPFVASGAVSNLVKKAIERAGVKSVRKGAHVFRHTLATEMLRRGASLTEIGRVLRHRDPNSTMIYAKVDLGALRELALPWPGGVR
jgi:site-specific recombinase XerD